MIAIRFVIAGLPGTPRTLTPASAYPLRSALSGNGIDVAMICAAASADNLKVG
jgi:hypothetical protein